MALLSILSKVIFSLLLSMSVSASEIPPGPAAPCEFKGIRLYGKVQFVESFPDIKVQYVTSFPDIKVKMVSSFPDDCGEWQQVNSFPDFKVQVVESFPDLKVQLVDHFPGMN